MRFYSSNYLVESCGNGLKVMRMLGKGDAESVINRFPKINGKKYYFYDKFNYPDFNFIGYKELESYNLVHFGNYYDILINHIYFLMQKKNNSEIKNILDNSILSSKELLNYSGNKDKLNETIEALRERID